MAGDGRHSQRFHRKRDRARLLALVWTWLWAGMTLLWLAAPVTIWTGIDPVRDNEAATGGLILAVVTGALTACGVMRLRMLNLDTGRLDSSADPAARNEAATPWTAVVRRSTLPGPQSAARALADSVAGRR